VFAVRKNACELARGSVKPIMRGEVRPIERKPFRSATTDAPGTQFKNTSIPRIRSSAS
jgi:hypothetical protein